ncbi:MAG: nuclear transport factor 2 family protein [Acidimicrobiales bacterium]
MTDHPSSPAAVVRSYLASFSGGDPESVAAHVSVDFVNEHTSALGSSCRGRGEYAKRLEGFLADMVDIEYSPDELIVDGSTVMALYTLTGRWKGERSFRVQGAQRLRVDDGLIASRLDFWDSASFLAQVDDAAASALAAYGVQAGTK